MEKIVKEILKSKGIDFKYIVKANAGFTSIVYIVDDNYVIKLASSEIGKQKLEKEVNVYSFLNDERFPELVATGDYDKYKYLIITKILGKSLYDIWHYIPESERFSCVKQICEILRIFHSQSVAVLHSEFVEKDFAGKIKNELFTSLNCLEQNDSVSKTKEFLNGNFDKFVTNNNLKVIYNDIHFDNFIYNEGKVYLIDFDRVEVYPFEYEHLILLLMCEKPDKFAGESNYMLVRDEDFKNVYAYFKECYEQMFQIENLKEKLEIFKLNYLIEQALETKNKEWQDKLIYNFNEFFGLE